MPRPTKATINVAHLKHNLAFVRSRVGNASIFAVVKANAYGHGVERAARAFSAADGLALLEIDAAVEMRAAGYAKRIVLLEGVFDVADLHTAAAHDLALVVHSAEQLRMLDAAPPAARYDVLLKVNSGMNRLGFTPHAAGIALAQLKNHRVVCNLTLMTHFASADGAHGVAWQTQEFERVAHGHGLARTLANSAALLRYPDTHADWVRPGIMLYGCSPFADLTAAQLGLKPAMTLASELIAVRTLAAGERLGYSGTYVAPAAVRVGIVACGYADGYPRHAPTGTPILVGGRRTCTLGLVAMDMLAVDLSSMPEAHVGTPVTLWGEGLSADEVAASSGTVSYELLCAVAARVPIVEV